MSHHQRISELVDKHHPLINDLSQQIWNDAELRFEEHQSSALLENALEEHGFNIARQAGGIYHEIA